MAFENKGALATTIVVAASDSLNQAAANYICDGVNDHVEIQAALDALPATGGEVLLLDGTYNIEVSLAMDSYQTLRGCGPNTVLTTSTTITGLITAVGGSGTEKVGIVVADLRIDGASTAYSGIYWDYVDYSDIRNVRASLALAALRARGRSNNGQVLAVVETPLSRLRQSFVVNEDIEADRAVAH